MNTPELPPIVIVLAALLSAAGLCVLLGGIIIATQKSKALDAPNSPLTARPSPLDQDRTFEEPPSRPSRASVDSAFPHDLDYQSTPANRI